MKVKFAGEIKEYNLSIDYEITGNFKELARPWEYAKRHFSLAFGNEELKLTVNKTNIVSQDIINQPEPIITIDLKDRIIHLLLGIANAIFGLNYLVAKLDKKYLNTSEVINKDIPIDKLRTEAILPRTDQSIIDEIYDILGVIDPLFRENKIPYSLCAGSQLGATRHVGEDGHGGIMPWDDDGDIAIELKDRSKVEQLKNEFIKAGFKFRLDEGMGFIQISGEHAHVDIFFMEKKEDKYVYSGIWSYQLWGEREYFTEQDWESVDDVQFGDLTLRGLPKGNAENYLKRAYGPKSLETAIKTHSHTDNTFNRFAELVRLENKDYAHHS